MESHGRSFWRQLAQLGTMGMQLGISVVAGLVLGSQIDRYFRFEYLFTILLMLIGFTGGVLNILRLLKKFTHESE